MSLHCSRIRK